MDDNRRRPRFRISNTIQCQNTKSSKSFLTVIRDISESGVKLTCEESMQVDQPVKFKINLIDQQVEGTGKVVWCDQQPRTDRFQIGIQFTAINQNAQKSLSHFLGNIETLS
jgi:c-di-GMP-binding flagellar brake protein YcgR